MPNTMLDSRYSWLRLALSLLVSLIGNVGMWAIIVVLPAVQAEFGTDRAGASIPYVATMLGFALGNYAIGRAVDRFGVVRCLVASGGLIAVGYAASAHAPNIAVLTMLQFIVGFGTASCFGPLIADVSQWFLKRRGIAVALIASGNYLPAREAGAKVGLVIMATIVGMALGGWMSGWIFDLTGSYTWAFLNGIAFNALNIGIMLAIVMRAAPRAPRPVPA